MGVHEAKQMPSDEALVSGARAGDRQAFAELVVRHQRMLLILCERSLADTALAHDAAQEAILQALLGLDSLKRPAQFGAWLAGIGLNVCRRWLRARAGASFSLDSLLGGQRVYQAVDALAPDPAWLAEEHELATRVRRVVQTLPTGQRKAVALFYLSGLSQVETAAALGIPVSAVKTRLHKARDNLRRELWSLWEEMQPMSTIDTTQQATSDYVDVDVIDVRRIVPNEQYTIGRNVVLLQETGGQRRILGIWIGAIEGEAILILLSGVEVPRPLTFNFAINLLEAAGGRLRQVRVNRLVNKTFFAETIIQAPDGQERLVDARPSDAISLALTRNAPIRVAEVVMTEAAWPPSGFEIDLRVDGERVLGKADILKEMERTRAQREAEMERLGAERRASRQTSA
jgi:RNA polymerase sigma factor (sigma-70 family)